MTEIRSAHAPGFSRGEQVNPKTCAVIDCDRPVFCRQVCGMHYQRMRAGIPVNAPRRMPATGPCRTEGCDKPVMARGLCRTHYDRQHRPRKQPTDAVLVENVEWLAGWERDPDRLAQRVGYASWDTLAPALRRMERHDLVQAVTEYREVAWAVAS